MENGCEVVVMLIPSRTETSYYHDYIFNRASEVRFIKGRIKFYDEKGEVPYNAPFPSAVVIYTKDNKPTKYSSFDLGDTN